MHAIENKVVGLLAISVDIRSTATGSVVAIVEARRTWCHGPRGKQCQLDMVARGQWQRVISFGIDDGVNLGGFRL